MCILKYEEAVADALENDASRLRRHFLSFELSH